MCSVRKLVLQCIAVQLITMQCSAMYCRTLKCSSVQCSTVHSTKPPPPPFTLTRSSRCAPRTRRPALPSPRPTIGGQPGRSGPIEALHCPDRSAIGQARPAPACHWPGPGGGLRGCSRVGEWVLQCCNCRPSPSPPLGSPSPAHLATIQPCSERTGAPSTLI